MKKHSERGSAERAREISWLRMVRSKAAASSAALCAGCPRAHTGCLSSALLRSTNFMLLTRMPLPARGKGFSRFQCQGFRSSQKLLHKQLGDSALWL